MVTNIVLISQNLSYKNAEISIHDKISHISSYYSKILYIMCVASKFRIGLQKCRGPSPSPNLVEYTFWIVLSGMGPFGK